MLRTLVTIAVLVASIATNAFAEIVNQPKASLVENAKIIVVGTCTSIESTHRAAGNKADATYRKQFKRITLP